MTKVCDIGNDLKITVTLKDIDGNATDASTLDITIRDSGGADVVTKTIGDLSTGNTGVYYFYWNTTGCNVGTYYIDASGTFTISGRNFAETYKVKLTRG